MAKYKLLALDIDGTLVTGDGSLTEETKKSIQRVVQAGTTVVLTTGRGLQRVEKIYDDLALEGPLVLVNGAEIWLRPGVLLQRHYLPQEKREELYELALQYDAWYWTITLDGVISKRNWNESVFHDEWLKFGIKHDDAQQLRLIRETIQRWEKYQVTSSHPKNIEIGPKGLSKATALMELCDELDVTMDDVMAIGDSRNDMHMIESVGFGVAMANGSDELKAMADAVTSSNEENGVARAIEKHLLS